MARGGNAAGNPNDFFNMFMGGRNRERSDQTKPTFHKMSVTLEELFNGKKRKLAVTRNLQCPDCLGKGGSKTNQCQDCGGIGSKTQTVNMGPMAQVMKVPCTKCKGLGDIVDPASTCKPCNGKGTYTDKKILEVRQSIFSEFLFVKNYLLPFFRRFLLKLG